MTETERLFLKVLSDAMRGWKYNGEIPGSSAASMLSLSNIHWLLPVIADAVCQKKELAGDVIKEEKTHAIQQTIRQIIQTNEFLTLLLSMQEHGLDPVILKGIVCREEWPLLYLRLSVDDDLLVPPEEAPKYHRFFLEEGLHADEEAFNQPGAEETEDFQQAAEISYHKPDSPLYIELHKTYFPPDSDAYGDCNRFFEKATERTIRVQVDDVSVKTLHPEDHFLYLLLHAYKHFLHSGFGIRQICDMVLFAEKYGGSCIDWDYLYECCQKQHLIPFTAAIIKIGIAYLEFDIEKAGLPKRWVTEVKKVHEEDLLEDVLSSGLNGAADIDRLHSSNMTLEAVSAEKEHRHERGLMASVFPKKASLEGRYPYLKKFPFLLPVAWISRVFSYLKDDDDMHPHPAKSIQIGQKRVDLLKEYGIIDR